MSNKQVLILEMLGRFKYLSREQMAVLGIESYNSNYSKYCKELIEAKMIGVMDCRNYGLGYTYYLLEKGYNIISEHMDMSIDEIHYVKSTPVISSQTLYHRTYAIDFHIQIYLACQEQGYKIMFYDREIETLGSIKKNKTLERKTRVSISNGYLEPDAVFMLKIDTGNKLLCFELENKDYTKKSYQKVEKHVMALTANKFSQKYGHDKHHKVLFVYKNEATMESVRKKLRENIEGVSEWFLFKTYANVVPTVTKKGSKFIVEPSSNIFTNWITAHSEKVDLF